MKQAAHALDPQRRSLSMMLLALLFASTSCVCYEPGSGATTTEILADGSRDRTVAIGSIRGSASESWLRTIRKTTATYGHYEVDSLFLFAIEEPSFVLFSPLMLPWDLVSVILTGPYAMLDEALTFPEIDDSYVAMKAAVSDLAAKASSGEWQVDGKTGKDGRLVFDFRVPAVAALQKGHALSYRVEVDGEEPKEETLSLRFTVACASLPGTEPLEKRTAYWLDLATKCEPGEARDLVVREAERTKPATLASYRQDAGLPAGMSLLLVERYRQREEGRAYAMSQQDYSSASSWLRSMSELLADHDASRAQALQREATVQAAAYVAHYYKSRSLRSIPLFMFNYCRDHMKVAREFGDDRSAAIFSAPLAVRSGDLSSLRNAGSKDAVVAGLHQRAGDEVRRQRAERAYAAEVARIQAEEEAWHYRYLNGRGGSGGRGVSSVGSRSSQSGNRGSSGPSIADQTRAHRNWVQTQKFKAANRNRAFDQFDRRN